MFRDQKVIVVMPAYNAERTLVKTYEEIKEQDFVDQIILVDDCSQDQTVAIAKKMGDIEIVRHDRNQGYGSNQKTCYSRAIELGADIVVMVHPDYQYTPKLIPAMVSLIGNGVYSCVLGSRILGGYAVKSGMPRWKFVANRFLTAAQNLVIGTKLSEFHTGYRAFSRHLLETLDLDTNSDDFVFDNQMLAQIWWHGFTIAEVTCPTKYFDDSSSINFGRSVKYGFGCLKTSFEFLLADLGFIESRRFPKKSRKRFNPNSM